MYRAVVKSAYSMMIYLFAQANGAAVFSWSAAAAGLEGPAAAEPALGHFVPRAGLWWTCWWISDDACIGDMHGLNAMD